jgi:hypothetical protein
MTIVSVKRTETLKEFPDFEVSSKGHLAVTSFTPGTGATPPTPPTPGEGCPVIGITSALHDRAKTGRGQFVDIAMLDGQIAILENAIARYAATGQSPGPLGARHPSITPFAAYGCADAPIVIAAGNDQLFSALCGALSLPQDDPRFASNEARTANAEALANVLEGVLTTQPAAHWLPLLDAAGVPAVYRDVSGTRAVLGWAGGGTARSALERLARGEAGRCRVTRDGVLTMTIHADEYGKSPLVNFSDAGA